jgi:hypothetical protein
MPSDDVIDTFHPIPSLLQTFVDPADPLNYGPLWRHREGRHTPHLVVTSGQLDTFTPPRNHAGLAGSYSVPLASPIAAPLPVLSLLGIDDVGDTTVSGNLRTDDDAPLTAAVVQYPVDGHFAVFDNPVAQALVTEFFTSLHTDDVPTVHTTLE